MAKDQLAKFLKEARENADLTQKDISDKLGYMTPQFISNCERGLCSFPLSQAKSFIKVTKCSQKGLRAALIARETARIDKYF